MEAQRSLLAHWQIGNRSLPQGQQVPGLIEQEVGARQGALLLTSAQVPVEDRHAIVAGNLTENGEGTQVIHE